jgi:hypothetical protein
MSCCGGRGYWKPVLPKPVVLGEEGFFLLHYTGEPLEKPLIGDYTGTVYPFHQKAFLYTDKRDAVFLLGPEFEIQDQ